MICNPFCRNDVSFLLPTQQFLHKQQIRAIAFIACKSLDTICPRQALASLGGKHVFCCLLRPSAYVVTPTLLSRCCLPCRSGVSRMVPTDLLHTQPPAGGQNDRQHPEDGSPVARVLHPRACCVDEALFCSFLWVHGHLYFRRLCTVRGFRSMIFDFCSYRPSTHEHAQTGVPNKKLSIHFLGFPA